MCVCVYVGGRRGVAEPTTIFNLHYNHMDICLLLLSSLYFAHQHKAAGLKTKQNVKQRLQRLLIRCSLRFLFPVLKRGTNCRKKSPLRHLYLPPNVTSRHSYLGNYFRTLLLIDTLVDLVVT